MDVLIWAVLLAAVTFAIWAGEQLKGIKTELRALREKLDKKWVVGQFESTYFQFGTKIASILSLCGASNAVNGLP